MFSAFFIVRPPGYSFTDVAASMSGSRGDDGTAAMSLPYRKIIHSMRIMLLHVAAHMIAKYAPQQ
jgi:hypothetical protein